MNNNSLKTWSLTLGLLLAPSYLSLTGATPAAPAAVPSVVGPSMSSSVSPTRATPVAARSDRRPTSSASPTRATRPTLAAVGNNNDKAIEFEKRVPQGIGADLLLYKAAFEGELGFNAETGRDYLDALAKDGDRDAARLLNLMNRGQPW